MKLANRRGVALIIMLLMVSLIVAVTVQFNRASRDEIYDAANLGEGIRLYYVARSGFHAGQALLLADRNAFDGLTELWADTRMLSLHSESFFDGASFRLRIEDEEGKIPINHLVSASGAVNAPLRDLLLRLLTGPHFRLGSDQGLALLEAIKDWIDQDDAVTGAGGAEGAYYAGLPHPYRAKNAPLDCIEELLMIKGITREFFYGAGDSPGLADCLTVFGEGKVNVNTAPLPVLLALAEEMTPELVDALDAYRRDPSHDLADVNWYLKIPRATGLNFPPGLLAVRSETFKVTVLALQGAMTKRVTGVVQRNSDRRKTTLLSWKVD
ncbi:MAG: type II secretion system minor pseudopilin GspK [Syntrophaceae bacterium]|nr:type II secretion system minor pseudopilin GspK [Syntrophaceae bacterium]